MTALAPPSPTPAAGPRRRTSGFGIAALALGLVALLLGLIPFVGFVTWILGVVGVVLGIVGLVQKDRRHGLPAAGLVVSAIAIVVGLAVSIVSVIGVGVAVSRSLDQSGPGRIVIGGSEFPDATESTSWYAQTYGTFATTRFSGTGDDVIHLPDGAKGGLVVATYSGSGDFAISGLDTAEASTGELLVNTIGRYRGTTAWGLSDLGGATMLKVSADGRWRIALKPMASATALPKKGIGDGVFRYAGGATTWSITHRGDSNFVVAEYTASPVPNLAVNEIGHYRGRVPVDAGPAVVLVNADGRWTIK